MMTKSGFAVGVVCVVCQTMLVIPVVSAASDMAATNSKMASPGSQQAKEINQLATRLLRQADEARQATSTNKQTAMTHIDQALGDWRQLKAMTKSNNPGVVVPLYSEFDETSTLGPMMAARKGKEQDSKQKMAKYAPVTVEGVSGEFTFVGLDLDKSKSRLDAAKMALHNSNTQAASDSLAAIGTDLVMESDETSFPLLAARENLGIAESAVKDGHIKEATAALKEASSDLNTYAGTSSVRHADDGKNLSKTIESYSQDMSKNLAGAWSKIDGWWHQVDGWFEAPNHKS